MVGNEDNEEQPLVAVAIGKDKGSQAALKWAVDNLMGRGQTIILIHVKNSNDSDESAKELFVPFRCFCMRKDIPCQDYIITGQDVAKTILQFVTQNALEKLVVGASSKTHFMRFKGGETSSGIVKGAPDFCNVYVISKEKVTSTHKATRRAPMMSPLRSMHGNNNAPLPPPEETTSSTSDHDSIYDVELCRMIDDRDTIQSPFARKSKKKSQKTYSDRASSADISFASSNRPPTPMIPSIYDDVDSLWPQRSSTSSELTFESARAPYPLMDAELMVARYHARGSQGSSSSSWDDVDSEMRRLKLELKHTIDMYGTACKEAITAKQKASELRRWKLEEEQRQQVTRLAEEAALAMVEKERAKCRAAMEEAEAAKQKAVDAEKKALQAVEERNKAVNSLSRGEGRCRKYTIEEIEVATDYFAKTRKIGEGGYGPVFKCCLDHTPVAVKVLRPDAAQGRLQFQQEVEVLSRIRHPNMVLLLGACPEYGCLVYEYMANGSLDDCIFHRGTNKPVLPWQLRFRIAAEIATALLFLHNTKPEPLVHRDLKPANILLDRNYVSKISDVGLARLVPPNVSDAVTQYRLTSAAGTFCYIDPEYQQTGMLGIKSDVYSLGVMLLQLVTAKPPMGLTHLVGRAIEGGGFARILDPAVGDWPVEEAMRFAKLALRCAEMRRKDRPDLGDVVLPELNNLREIAETSWHGGFVDPSRSNLCSIRSVATQDMISEHPSTYTDSDSSKSRLSLSSATGKRTSLS